VKILTANRLADGAVVWLTALGDWSRSFAEAVSLDSDAADAALIAALAQPRLLVGPYLVEVEAAAVDRRERLREFIRADGPTVGHSVEPSRAPHNLGAQSDRKTADTLADRALMDPR
jgi:hypothetical protein